MKTIGSDYLVAPFINPMDGAEEEEEGREALIEKLAIDMANTIGGWADDKIEEAYDQFWSYANDWYEEYRLTAEEVDSLAEQAKDFFAEEEGEVEEELPADYNERREHADILIGSPAWDGLTDPHDLAMAYELWQLKEMVGMLEEAERDHLDDLDSLDRTEELSPLARLRIRAGMTQGELAEAAGVHINIVGRLERGERSPEKMQLITAIAIAEILGCRPEDLI